MSRSVRLHASPSARAGRGAGAQEWAVTGWPQPCQPGRMRIAAIADAHGNLLALEAVLADLRAQAPDLVVNLGDLVSGPFDPASSADAQIALAARRWPATTNATSWKAMTQAHPMPSRGLICRPHTWTGSPGCPKRSSLRTGRCSPATAARPAVTRTTCLKM